MITWLVLIISLIGIIYSANILIDGSSEIAKRFNISNFIIGALIVGVGTSLPEFVVSLTSTIQHNYDIAIGNIVGSNIFNVFGILGITALIFPIKFNDVNSKFDISFCMVITMLLMIFIFNSATECLHWFEGIMLLLMFAFYIWFSFKDSKPNGVETTTMPIWLSIIKIIAGLSILIISCKYFIDISILIARNIGLSEATIGLTLVACGTSLPELAASIAAACKKNPDIAVGNIVGSNIFNICLILGTCSIFGGKITSPEISYVDYFILLSGAFLVLACADKGKMSRMMGLIMLIIFSLYVTFLCI